MASRKVNKGAGAAVSKAKEVFADWKIRLQASAKISEGLLTELQNEKKDLADHAALVYEKKSMEDNAKLKLQAELRTLCAEFESYLRESKKKLNEMTTFDNEFQAHSAQTKKKRIQYYV